MRRLSACFALLILVLLASCGSGRETRVVGEGQTGLTDSQPQAETSDPSARYSEDLHCGRTGQEVTETRELANDLPGGPSAAEAALDAELSKTYPRLTSSSFTRVAESGASSSRPPSVLFSYSDPDLGDLRMFTEYLGDSWYVTSYKVCYSLDQRERGK